jgi:hypothetical protein
MIDKIPLISTKIPGRREFRLVFSIVAYGLALIALKTGYKRLKYGNAL